MKRPSLAQVTCRYGALSGLTAEYLFELAPASPTCAGQYVDGSRSEHPSRYINHAEHGNLIPSPAGAGGGGQRRIDFYAARPIAEGEELAFDYGIDYWAARPTDPLPSSDSRLLRIRLGRALLGLAPLVRALQLGWLGIS